MTTEETQPQPEEEQDGAEEQSEPEEKQEPELKKEEEKPKERTYTQTEWSKRESEKDKEIASLNQRLAQYTLDSEIKKQEESEKVASKRDQEAVSSGLITEKEAEERAELRKEQAKVQKEILEAQQRLQRMSVDSEKRGRLLAAQDFGKQYELSDEEVTELLNDQSINNPFQMQAKAADLALEKMRGELGEAKKSPPKYDKGQKSQGAGDLPRTPKELIKSGWEEVSRKKK